MRKKNKKQVFENVEVIDAGAKGKTIGKAPDGRVIFMTNTVPGDVVDVQTTKKRKSYFEGKATHFHSFPINVLLPNVSISGLVAVANGNTWATNTNYSSSKKKLKIIFGA